MLKRFAPLVPLALVTLLFGCAAHTPAPQQEQNQQVINSVTAQSSSVLLQEAIEQEAASDKELASFGNGKSYQLPVLADSILERGMSLIGTRYRFGGTSEAGFDCSGFIGYLFREEAGMNLPRSTREMINVDAPLVTRSDLKPGDLLFFATNGRRGRVSHAGIYLGDNQFIHSSSRRSGGVRIDSLGDSYWSKTFIEAKRALAMAPDSTPTIVTARK
ncbi:peptidase P60 [Pseudomonas silesiensis]|jgi:cell wall-associated NlpC family hydrolase|uniref:Peptidase P60 n=1 Tax=Pseudomonas silesiensis TaxID=1853130 RepID=A0A191YXB5_9PSED|nr:NlpC/P60 family protein [Pseudomonas silesiensis]ANJ57527.1 peptidase P60 [Pseudomonas silesiensis]VVO60234.1 Murein DD-endopeptidase MepS/Murein LD-carboxypeptidase [Pseudomonas fluorescens]VVO85780.1 Murein DD-endopeptidase MepS/Murein LD-carboxypeptidase [Pseudomonas fluorescens]VVP03625.1 Murein DD-endopeptidase MepS/Murein LD-carboxypeptidase [Pseudomonas fluorescens]